MRKGFVILLLLTGIFFIMNPLVQAQVGIDEGSVEIDFKDEAEYIEVTETPIPTPTRTPPPDTILYGQEKEQFELEGAVIRTSLPYQKNPISLEVSYSGSKVEFRDLKPNVTYEKTFVYAVTGPGLFSYQTSIFQDKQISSLTGLTIESTLCDRVRNPCSTTFARRWQLNEAPGFGYRVTGADSPLDFTDATRYRILPVLEKKAPPEPLFTSAVEKGIRTGQIIFKVVPPPTFQENTYISEVTILTYPRL
jgi:hypothetical protein